MACLCVIQNKKEKCRQVLEKMLEDNESLYASDLEQEEDFRTVRNTSWFQELIRKLKEKNMFVRDYVTFDYG